MKTRSLHTLRAGEDRRAGCVTPPRSPSCATGDSAHSKASGEGAFSLIEVMVTIGLLTLIILGLLTMFSQTQKAFRGSMTQTDVLEAGRSVMDLLTRDVEQAMATRYPELYYGPNRVFSTNFFIETTSDLVNPLVQDLPGAGTPAAKRANFLQRFFFLSKFNLDWVGIGYEVAPSSSENLVGTLYRFSITNVPRKGPFTFASTAFRTTAPTNMSRIADGVVHFRVRPYAPNGFPILADQIRPGVAFVRTNGLVPTEQSGIFRYAGVRDAYTVLDPRAPDQMFDCYLFHDALPAYVEVELGILEPQIYQRYKTIPEAVPAARRQFLSDHVAQVHVFRQRIALRNVDVSVYP